MVPLPPTIKDLAVNEKPRRDAALAAVALIIKDPSLPLQEHLRLWKALFYSFWMTDRPLPQQRLAQNLADFVLQVPLSTVFIFLRAFWMTIVREWPTLDIHRVDKFYLLMRKYVAVSFSLLHQNQWDPPLMQEYITLLEQVPLNSTSVSIPNAIRLHLCDIYLDELQSICPPPLVIPIDDLVSPFLTLSTQSPSKAVRARAKETVLSDARLQAWGYTNSEEVEEEEEFKGFN